MGILMDQLKLNKMEKIYIIIAIVFLCSTVYLLVANHLLRYHRLHHQLEIDALKQEMNEKQRRLTNYTLTSIELNNVCDQFQSSRNAKAENKKLQDLLNEIN